MVTNSKSNRYSDVDTSSLSMVGLVRSVEGEVSRQKEDPSRGDQMRHRC